MARRCACQTHPCLDCTVSTAGVLIVSCASLLAWLVAVLLRFPAGDFSPVVLKYRWNDAECTTKSSFVCEDADAAFHFSATKADWFAARESCQSRGMSLASLHSDADAQKLMEIHQLGGEHSDIWIGLNDRGTECGTDGTCFLWQDGSELVWTAWADGEPNDWSQTANRPGNGPGPSANDGSLGEDCVMAFACNNALNRGCNAATKHLRESHDSQVIKEDREEINDYRRWATAMLAVGSLGCGFAALLACVASVASGQSLLIRARSGTSTVDADHVKAPTSTMRR